MDLRSVVKEKTYIPKWMDNDKSDPHNQFHIVFRKFPGSAELGKYIGDGKIDFQTFLIDCIDKVVNLKINGNTVGNGYALSQARYQGLSELFVELFNYAVPENEELKEGE